MKKIFLAFLILTNYFCYSEDNLTIKDFLDFLNPKSVPKDFHSFDLENWWDVKFGNSAINLKYNGTPLKIYNIAVNGILAYYDTLNNRIIDLKVYVKNDYDLYYKILRPQLGISEYSIKQPFDSLNTYGFDSWRYFYKDENYSLLILTTINKIIYLILLKILSG